MIANRILFRKRRRRLCLTAEEKEELMHRAIIQDNLQLLDAALKEDFADVNRKNSLGQTPLMFSLSTPASDSLILRLLEAGCNVNITDADQLSPLHEAVISNRISIAEKLIKNGANVNIEDNKGHTPLYYAILVNRIEAVCMLLHYGAAAISWKEFRCMIVMESSNGCNIRKDNLAIIEVLYNYYDDFYKYVDDFCLALLQYTQCDGMADTETLSKCAKLFTLLWPKITPDQLTNIDILLVLRNFDQYNQLSNVDWVNCFCVLLEWLEKNNLINSCFSQFHHIWHLLKALHLRKIDKASREKIMWILVCSRVDLGMEDIYLALKLFGFNEEVEALIHGIDVHKSFGPCHCWDLPLPLFILAREENSSPQEVLRLFINQIDIDVELNLGGCVNAFSRSLRYFSLPKRMKKELQCRCLNEPIYDNQVIREKIQQVVEFPSLVELSRNKVRDFVKQTYSVKQPYEFHEAVKNLNAPVVVKDIIRFKRPIYY